MNVKAFLIDKKNIPLIAVVVCSIVVYMMFGGSGDEQTVPPEKDVAAVLETRLERVLSKVKGAGKVSVFVSLDDYGATDYAKDSRETVRQDQSESEHKTVMQGSGNSSLPVVTRTSSPKVKGVIVVAEGAMNQSVRANLSSAVESSLAIMPHRIKILEGN